MRDTNPLAADYTIFVCCLCWIPVLHVEYHCTLPRLQELGEFSSENSFVSHPGVGPDISVHILGVADQGVGEPDGSVAAMEFQPALAVANTMIQDAQRGADAGAGRWGWGGGQAPDFS
jgi:hypothetical protein